jgi:hypothetical protein
MNRVIIVAVVFAATLFGCSQDPYSTLELPKEFFAKNRIGSAPDYGVIKFGNREDHVITVHGFSDDGASCKEVIDALNVNACKETDGQSCLNPYSCVPLNQ